MFCIEKVTIVRWATSCFDIPRSEDYRREIISRHPSKAAAEAALKLLKQNNPGGDYQIVKG